MSFLPLEKKKYITILPFRTISCELLVTASYVGGKGGYSVNCRQILAIYDIRYAFMGGGGTFNRKVTRSIARNIYQSQKIFLKMHVITRRMLCFY